MEEKSKGLGDSLSKIFHTLKIDKVADAVAHLAGVEGCGCEERKEFLNKLFPYGKSRKFKALKDFEWEGRFYSIDDIIKVSKEDSIHKNIIDLVRDKKIKEL